MRAWGVLFALLVLVAGVACGGSRGAGTATVTPTQPAAANTVMPTASTGPASPTGAPASAATCDRALPDGVVAGASASRTLESGGLSRRYRVHVPASIPSGAMALVLNFHGLGGDGAGQETYSGLVKVSDREGFLLVSPDGTGSPRGWNAILNSGGTNDVQFVRDMLDALEVDFCIDAARVFSTGFSNGAFLSSLLGCVLGDRIAAVAPVAGVYYPSGVRCAEVPLLAIHGTADAVVPFKPGLIFNTYPYAGAREGEMAWEQNNGCSGERAARSIANGITEEEGRGCAADTRLVVVEGGGHTWPGGVFVAGLGETTKDLSAAEFIWQFFASVRPGGSSP